MHGTHYVDDFGKHNGQLHNYRLGYFLASLNNI